MNIQKRSRFILSLFVLALLANSASGQQGTKQTVTGKLVEVKIPAPSLKANLVGDPAEQNVGIYLPPSYESSPTKRYPTVYLLHGFGLDQKMWTTSAFGVNVPPILDAMAASGKILEMIVVFPNGRNTFSGSFYTNSEVAGNWEDYIYRDVVSYIDANYRTIARASSRGIAGHSMGGYGAVAVGMKHSDTFSTIYALSPCCIGLEGDLNEPNPVWRRLGGFTSKDQLPIQVRSIEDFSTLVLPAFSVAFAPNKQRPPFFSDFLFQDRDGKLEQNQAVNVKWKSKMPLYMIEEYKQNLLSMRGIFIDYGQLDEISHIRVATALFSKALAGNGIPHTFEIYAGGTHTNKVKERLETRVFNFFSDRLDFSNP